MTMFHEQKWVSQSVIAITLRFVVGLNFLSAAIAYLHLAKFYVEESNKITPWITNCRYIGNTVAIVLLVTGFLLIAGLKTIETTLIGIAAILINHICLLFVPPYHDPFSGPFYNTFHHSTPFLAFLIFLYYILPGNKLSCDSFFKMKTRKKILDNDVLLLAGRIFVGSIFLAQGLNIFFGKGGFAAFADNVYVKGFSTTFVPSFLLWAMGILNPFILVTGGVLLVAGLKIKWGCVMLSLFFISIAFGHLLSDPFETSGDISMYGFNNLSFVLVILLFENRTNRFSLDKLFNPK